MNLIDLYLLPHTGHLLDLGILLHSLLKCTYNSVNVSKDLLQSLHVGIDDQGYRGGIKKL